MTETLTFVWFGLSLSARRRGLLGEVLRTEARGPVVRLMEYLGLAQSASPDNQIEQVATGHELDEEEPSGPESEVRVR